VHWNESPFETGWYSQELEGYRDAERHSTYHYYSYDSLPPLPENLFKKDFAWLRDRDAVTSFLYSDLERFPTRLSSLKQQAAALNLPLPLDFTAFMATSWLPSKMRSCTDCYFDLPSIIQPCSSDLGGFIVSFLADSQGVLYWGLYVSPSGDSCVVNSPEWYEAELMDEDWDSKSDEDDEASKLPPSVQDLLYCAPSFEAFIYRFWIENEIWFAINDGEPLDELQIAYLSHYK
jgi:hypothetical protein